MTDYGKGSILGSATTLPATAGAGLILVNHADPIIVAGLFVISAVSFVVLTGSITRYVINHTRNK